MSLNQVSNQHLLFKSHLEDCIKMRTVFQGDKAIKANAKTYVPKNKGVSDEDYNAIIQRSVFENFTEATAKGISGLIFAKEPTISVPTSLEILKDNIDMDDNTIVDLSQNIVNELMEVGRCGLLIDVPNIDTTGMTKPQTDALNIRAFMKLYKSETIINWRYESINSVNKLTLLVLHEVYEDWTDDFTAEYKNRYRVYKLIKNVCNVAVYEEKRVANKKEKDFIATMEFKPVMANKKKINYIPFIPLTYKDISIVPTKPPLMDIADININYYGVAVERRNVIHFVGNPFFMGKGINTRDDKGNTLTITLGSSIAQIFQEVNADMKIVETQGTGLAFNESYLNDCKVTMAALGARLLVDDAKAQISENTMQMKTAGYRATIMQIANTASRAITQALKIIAEWENQNPDEVKLELNTDYNLSEMDAQTITALVTAWQTGAIRKEDMFHKFQKGEIIESGISFDDYNSNLEITAPTL